MRQVRQYLCSSSTRFVLLSFFLSFSETRLCFYRLCACVCAVSVRTLTLTFSSTASAAAATKLLSARLSIYNTSVPSPFAIFSRLSHTHPHLVVAVHVDKRRVIAGPHDAIVLIFNGRHPVVEQGLLELVLVLLKVPEEEGRRDGRREGG